MTARWLLCVAGVLLLVACHRVMVGTTRTTSAWGEPHVVRIGIVSDPYSLNPLFVISQTSIDTATLYTETLVALNDRNELIPLAAERVPTRANGDISPDGLTITYHLRHDNRFADGVLLTSRDVAFTYRAILDRRNPVSSMTPYLQVAALDTPNPFTVRIHLRQRWAAAVSELFAASDFAYGVLPAHVFGGNTDIAHAAWNERPFGSGPFRVVAWRHGDEIVFEPNPFARRRPQLQKVIIKIFPDRNTMFIALQTHTIDAEDLLTLEQAKEAQAIPGIRIIHTAMNETDYLEFQTTRFPTTDSRVRRAIVDAVDRNALRNNIYLGLQDTATTEIPTVLWAHDRSIPENAFKPEQVGPDLTVAGWRLRDGVWMKNNIPLQIDLAFNGNNDQARRLVTEVQAQLRTVGIAVTLHGYPTTLLYAPASAGGIYASGRFNILFGGLYGGSDPEASESWTCSQQPPNGINYSRFCNEEYDRSYNLQRTSFDPRIRQAAFFKIQKLMRQAYVLDDLVYSTDYNGLNPALQNYRPNMLFEFWNSEHWDIR